MQAATIVIAEKPTLQHIGPVVTHAAMAHQKALPSDVITKKLTPYQSADVPNSMLSSEKPHALIYCTS